jgi:hypothetical protein
MPSVKCRKVLPKTALIVAFCLSLITDIMYFFIEYENLFGQLENNRTGLCELAAAVVYEIFLVKCCFFAFVEKNMIDLKLLVIMSAVKSVTITLVTLPWDTDYNIFNYINLAANILYVVNNFIFGYLEFKWNMSWFISKVFGLDADLKENLRIYYWLKGQGQLFSLFGIVLAICGALIFQGVLSGILGGLMTLWFIYTAF